MNFPPAKCKLDVFGLILLSLSLFGCSIQSVYLHSSVSGNIPPAEQASIRHTIFLIGDAGEPSPHEKEKTLLHLTNLASVNPTASTIVFLGDNIYPKGMPEPDASHRKEMERRLDAQIDVGKESGASTIFVPGNHDWEYQRAGGYQAVLREGEYIASRDLPNVTMQPKHGLPGPVGIDIGDMLRLIAIDTQWWLHQYEKPNYAGAATATETKQQFVDSLSVLLKSAGDRTTIVVAHHPIRSHGEHSGFFDYKDHLFPLRKLYRWMWIPLPGIGSIYPLSRLLGITGQDFSGTANSEMRRVLDSVLTLYRPAAYASGHEHSLQVLKEDNGIFYLVSGNGIAHHDESLTTGGDTMFASRWKGFMRIDLLYDGRVRLGVIAADDEYTGEIFSIEMK